MENEVWKDVIGYEGLYQVSNFGNVKTLKYGKEKILKPGKNSHGYLQVVLCKNNTCKSYSIHRLVAQSFIPNPLNLSEINHKNENKTDNNVYNLEWCEHKYNINYGSHNERSGKARINHPKRSKSIIGINKINGYICEFPSICEAERVINIIICFILIFVIYF